jgi:hypothetical protein
MFPDNFEGGIDIDVEAVSWPKFDLKQILTCDNKNPKWQIGLRHSTERWRSQEYSKYPRRRSSLHAV